ncbi:MAG: formyltransferase family protein [Chitinophagaceae bacterium]
MTTVSFFLMSHKGLSVLKSAVEDFGASFIDNVITSTNKNVKEDYCEDILSFCRSKKIKVYLKEDKFEIKTQYAFAIGWRWLIPDADKYKLIVLHDSLLPRNRGFNPLVTSLVNGDTKIGITALFSADKYDCGPIIDQEVFDIQYPCKIQRAIEIITDGYIRLVKRICLKVKEDTEITALKQDESLATYSLWRDEEDYKIDWTQDAEKIQRFVNAVGFPYAGASSTIDGKLIRIDVVELYEDLEVENRIPGKLIFFEGGHPVIVCGKGLLCIRSMRTEAGERFLLKKFRTRFK